MTDMQDKLENNYSVYQHVTPDGMYYFGQTQNVEQRWRGNGIYYRKTALQPYIEKFGWDNIQHIILFENQTKENALWIEDFLITTAREDGVCINKNRSGSVSKEEGYYKNKSKQYYEQNKEQIKEQKKQYIEQNKEQIREYQREYREQNKDKIREQQKQYREQNKDKKKEYYEQNKQQIREQQKQYYEQNKDKKQQYYEQNKHKRREYQREYYKRKKEEKQFDGYITLF